VEETAGNCQIVRSKGKREEKVQVMEKQDIT
jgi:hypothetical protein